MTTNILIAIWILAFIGIGYYAKRKWDIMKYMDGKAYTADEFGIEFIQFLLCICGILVLIHYGLLGWVQGF